MTIYLNIKKQQENEQLKQDYAQSEQARMELISQIN